MCSLLLLRGALVQGSLARTRARIACKAENWSQIRVSHNLKKKKQNHGPRLHGSDRLQCMQQVRAINAKGAEHEQPSLGIHC